MVSTPCIWGKTGVDMRPYMSSNAILLSYVEEGMLTKQKPVLGSALKVVVQ